MIEEEFNKDVYYKDKNWAQFNSKYFKYGNGGWHFTFNNSKKTYHPNPGFVTQYATSGLEEDKAEVYACLFVEEISACLDEWTGEDEMLRDKVDYMKDFLLQQCDKMNDDYWAALTNSDCTMPCTMGGVCKEEEVEPEKSFTAFIDEDSYLELIAVATDADDGPKFWKPDGEVFDETLFTKVDYYYSAI